MKLTKEEKAEFLKLAQHCKDAGATRLAVIGYDTADERRELVKLVERLQRAGNLQARRYFLPKS